MMLPLLVLAMSLAVRGNPPPRVNVQPQFLAEINKETRKEIFIQISNKLKDIIESQTAVMNEMDKCEKLLNDTFDECSLCMQNLCVPKPGIDKVILLGLEAGYDAALGFAGDAVGDMANWFEGAGGFFENRAKDFIAPFAAISIDFNNIQLPGIDFSGFADRFKDITNRLNNFFNGLKDTLSNLKIPDFEIPKIPGIPGIGRKKREAPLKRYRRCVDSCPVCDKIDPKKHTSAEIAMNVCGITISEDASATAMKNVAFLSGYFNDTRDHPNILSAVAFSPASQYWDEYWTSYFRISFYALIGAPGVYETIQGFEEFSLANKTKIGIAIGQQVFNTKWDNKP